MRALFLAAALGVAALMVQPTQAHAQRWVPNNPYYYYISNGYGFGPGAALPWTVPFSGWNSHLVTGAFYNPYNPNVYFARVSGFSRNQGGYYSGTVAVYTTPYGTFYRFVPSFHNPAFFNPQATRNTFTRGGYSLPTY
jgi:hypothetical protein